MSEKQVVLPELDNDARVMLRVSPGTFAAERDIRRCRESQLLTLLQSLADAGIEVQYGLVAWPKWVERADRYEDMSPTGKLTLIHQPDGDIIVRVTNEEYNSAAVEFCIPMTGGGQSQHTHRALATLMVAMERDDAERKQNREASNNV